VARVDSLRFECRTGADCLVGSACQGGVCVDPHQDAGAIVAADAAAADRAGVDRVAGDTAASDGAITADTAVVDAASPADGGHDGGAPEASAFDAVAGDGASLDLAAADGVVPDAAAAGDGTALDANAGDVPGVDQGAADSAVEDAQREDAATSDTAVAESTRPDLAVEDAVTSEDAGPPRPTCTEQYGAAPDFVSCVETESTCRFYVDTNSGSCSELCAAFGGTCLDGWDNSGTCGLGSHDGCASSHSHQVCECSRPP
jgi:hypothetical protein